MLQQNTSLPPQFVAKKQDILSHLALDPEAYQDKSPKGSVDVQILDLIRLINGVDGWVTTSSCAGRVAVFVEGPQKPVPITSANATGASGPPAAASIGNENDGGGDKLTDESPATSNTTTTKTAPGGKGGGHWLYVNHDRPARPLTTASTPPNPQPWTTLFGLTRPPSLALPAIPPTPRLIHLSFSPLILHVLCATLSHARPLLSAAINAGFRESGVQSLKALDPKYVGEGVMVAIRTNGIVFETAVGFWDEGGEEGRPTALVTEAYLRMCVGVVEERFAWNEERRERLVGELKAAIGREGWLESGSGIGEGETREQKRERKRREGLERQRALRKDTPAAAKDEPEASGTAELEEINLQALNIG